MFKFIDQYIDFHILNNKSSALFAFILLVILGVLLKRFLAPILSKLVLLVVKKHSNEKDLDRYVKNLHKPIGAFVIVLFFYFGFIQLSFPKEWDLKPETTFGLNMILHRSYYILMVLAFMRVVMAAINVIGMIMLEKAKLTETKQDDHLVPFLKELSKVVVVLMGVLFMLGSIFKVNVATMVTSLGITGLAVALAGKETLENLFASFTIFLDKPFIAEDLIKVGDIIGRVEQVGFRSTRIRTLDRSLVTLPNKMLIDHPVDNYSEREVWRAKFDLGVTYDTELEVIGKIKGKISKYLQDHRSTNYNNRVFFSEFGDSALTITLHVFIITRDFLEFESIKDEINFELHKIVKDSGASFAFPTQTIHVTNDENAKDADLKDI